MTSKSNAPTKAVVRRAKRADQGIVRRVSVLYVEDSRMSVRLMQRIMASRPSIDLFTAATGRAAFEMAQVHLPDLILLDLHLSDIAGYELLRRLRCDPRTSATRVIVLSAQADGAPTGPFDGNGADGYLTKPLDVPRLLDIVDGLEASTRSHIAATDVSRIPVHPASVRLDPLSDGADAIRQVVHNLSSELGTIRNYAELLSGHTEGPSARSDLHAIFETTEIAIELCKALNVLVDEIRGHPVIQPGAVVAVPS